ncbi:MAG: MmgE/PrpD family protein [Gammaproteobacteria bacterium]|nr:MmgE/PrpD family protein [Gammaproteobacteria bacterium]
MTDPAVGLSDAICRHIATTPFEALPEASIEAARCALLDATGVMLAASGVSADAAPFVALAASAGPGPCALLGSGARASAPLAAFANGALAHALDYEDAFDAAPCHPNASLVPAAIAMAELLAPVDGRTFVTALAIGCDLACRVGLSLRQTMEESGWYPPPILGALGAAAAAARIAGLDAVRTRDALSLILCQATAPGEIQHSARSVIRAVREAFPAQAAVVSALLARAGVRGFETPLEGRAGFYRLYVDSRYDAQLLLEALGTRYWGEQLSFKPWPACRGTHAYIEIALELRAQHRFDWRAVDGVDVLVGPVQRMLTEPLVRKQAPATVIDAKFSIPFTVALALVRGRVTLDEFTPAALADPDVLALARRITARSNDSGRLSGASAGALSIGLADGRRIEGAVAQALGHPDRPLPRNALITKFIDCAGRAACPIEPARAHALAGDLLRIDALADVARLFQRL